MGARLVIHATTKWGPHCSESAFRVLVAMAVTALDDASQDRPAAMYFGGWQRLVDVMPRRLAAPDRAVKVAIAELKALGAIEKVGGGHAGRNAEYALRLHAAPNLEASDATRRPGPKERAGSRTPSAEEGRQPDPIEGRQPDPIEGRQPDPQGTTQDDGRNYIRNHSIDLGDSPTSAVVPAQRQERADGTTRHLTVVRERCTDPTCHAGRLMSAGRGSLDLGPCPTCYPEG